MQQLELMIALQGGQALFGLMLALLLIAFLSEFKHHFLRFWAMSFLAMACYFAASAGLILMLQSGGISSVPRLSVSALAQAAAYLQAAWLLLGTWEAINDRNAKPRVVLLLVTFAVVVAIGATLIQPFNADAAWLRLLLRYSLVQWVTGGAFLATAFMLWRALREQNILSARLTLLTFGSYGLYLVFLGSLSVWINLNRAAPAFVPYLGVVGFVLLIVIGYSIIIWLLELERQSSSSARKKAQSAEQRLSHLRQHDAATGLPNRRQLQDYLFHAVRSAINSKQQAAVLSIGIHRFNLVSQSLGWNKTDDLMRRLAKRLKSNAPNNATLGRIGERDFLLIIPTTRVSEKAVKQAQTILKESATPISNDGESLYLSLSGGLCFAPTDGVDAVDLINLAQHAQVQAAETGEALVVHESTPGAKPTYDLLTLERELRSGVQAQQFRLYFQPLINLRERRITGFESLLRWNHPERGVLTPGSFLQEAERLGVLDALEDQILAQALSQLRDWQNDLSMPELSVSINLSAQRFQQTDLAEKLADLCHKYEIQPGNLHVEITESTAMDDFESGLNTISALRKFGCQVCLDDFGTGYSSLAHLRRLNVDYVKLDRSFLTNLDRDPKERDLTRAVVDLIHSLGMTVLAEGVETKQQLGHMIQCRVDVVQGYLLGRPAPAADYRDALDRPNLVID